MTANENVTQLLQAISNSYTTGHTSPALGNVIAGVVAGGYIVSVPVTMVRACLAAGAAVCLLAAILFRLEWKGRRLREAFSLDYWTRFERR